MNFFSRYVAYIKDNPEEYWFKRKAYGWGWVPATWQGWSVIFLYAVLILGLVLVREKDMPGIPDSGSNLLMLVVPIIVLTVLLVIVAYKKGEKPGWMWGIPEDRDKK